MSSWVLRASWSLWVALRAVWAGLLGTMASSNAGAGLDGRDSSLEQQSSTARARVCRRGTPNTPPQSETHFSVDDVMPPEPPRHAPESGLGRQ